jgi:hypothetical protein
LSTLKPGDQGLLASKAFCEVFLREPQGFSRFDQQSAELELTVTSYRPHHFFTSLRFCSGVSVGTKLSKNRIMMGDVMLNNVEDMGRVQQFLRDADIAAHAAMVSWAVTTSASSMCR